MTRNPVSLAFRFLASYGLSIVIMALLMIITFIGTLEQVDMGLYEVQQRYFDSLVAVHWLFGTIPVPLPGVYLLLILLTINLVCGGIVRARKGWRFTGILIGHVGMLLLLVGSFVTFQYAERGNLTLYEGDQRASFDSYEEWELAISHPNADGTATELVIPDSDFEGLRGTASRTFKSGDLPFDLVLSGYLRNARLEAGAGATPTIKALPVAKEAGENLPVLQAKAVGKKSGSWDGIVAGMVREPWSFACEGVTYTATLRHRSWTLPFAVRLDKFTRELHPGTGIAKVYSSDVTKIEGNVQQPVKITMNEPLREKGYTLYQASWGPSNAGPNDRLYSSLAVVRNPGEQIPLYSCCIMAIGLLVHFGLKLALYLKKESGARA